MAKRRWGEQQPWKEEYDKLADAYDAFPLRQGDLAQRSTASSTGGHSNAYTVAGLIRQGFANIGSATRSQKGRVGIVGGRRGLESLCSVAGMFYRFFQRASAAFANALADASPGAVVILRHVDSTPLHVSFGELQAELAQAAKYFRPVVRVDPVTGLQTVGWQAVSYDEYRSLHPRSRPRAGVLELLAMHGSVVSAPACPVGEVAPLTMQRAIVPPVFIESTAASCVYLAVNTADPSLSNTTAKKIVRTVGCVIVSDTTDGCRANIRYKHATAAYFDDTPNAFYDEHSFCVAHTLHTCIAGSSGEVHLVGNVHAVSVVMHVDHRVRQLLGALQHLAQTELQVFAGPPPPENVHHTRAVLQTTVMRARSVVRARAGTEFVCEEDDGELAKHFRPVEQLLNGDIRRPVVQHFCVGCCAHDGRTTRAAQIENVVVALSLIFVALSQQAKPAANRWLSTSACLAYICVGFMFNSILPRCWHLAFGEFQVPRAPAVADTWQAYMKSKANRVSLWLSMDDAQTSALLFCYCCAPGEHLLEVFQHDSTAGGLLRSMQVRRASPVVACLDQYWRMLQHPLDELRVLLHHMHPQGLLLTSVVMSCVFSLLLALAAGIWSDVHMASTAWPFRLTSLTLDDDALFDETAAALFAASPCCLDARFTLKLRSLVGSPAGLRQATSVLEAVRIWSWQKRFDNMSTERLLKRYRVASPAHSGHPVATRCCAAGFLSEIQHAHLQSGGADVTRVTRAALLARDAPIRAASRKVAKAHLKAKPRNTMGRFASWAAAMQKAGRAAAGVEGHKPLGDRAAYKARVAHLRDLWRSENRPFLTTRMLPLPRSDTPTKSATSYGECLPRIGL